MQEINIGQKSTQAKILSEKEYIKKQFGEEEIFDRLYEVLGEQTIAQYNNMLYLNSQRKASKVVEILINLGLKKYE